MRAASRLLRSYHPGLDVSPFAGQQVVDAGDIAANPFDIKEAVSQIEEGVATCWAASRVLYELISLMAIH